MLLPSRRRGWVGRLLTGSASATSLATLRIVTFANVLMYFPRASALEGFAEVPDEFRTPPAGLGTVFPRLPITPRLIRGASRVTLAGAALATVGLCTTPACLAVIGAGLYVGSVQWYFTRVGHVHHTLWFAALVAVSPSTDALSIDECLRRRRRGRVHPLPSAAYGVPLRMGWLLLASIYFVPGVAKLATGGPRWIFSDNLRNRAWLEWHSRARQPGPALRRVADSPVLMRGAALMSVGFEIGFLFALPSRAGRRAMTVLSFLFHGGIWLVLDLGPFMSLSYTHLGLHDWWPEPSPPPGVPVVRRPASIAPAVTVAAIVAANHAMPLVAEHYGWPFTIYPIFHGVAGQEATRLRAELHRPGEEPRELDVRQTFEDHGLSAGTSSFLEGAVLSALQRPDDARVQALWRMMSDAAALQAGDRVVFFAEVVDVDPAWVPPAVLSRRELARRTIPGPVEDEGDDGRHSPAPWPVELVAPRARRSRRRPAGRLLPLSARGTAAGLRRPVPATAPRSRSADRTA
jgi:hypothetical protein